MGTKRTPKAKIVLTKTYCDSAKYEGDKNCFDVRWDAKCTGLGLRLNPGGSKTFVFYYKIDGRTKSLTLGKYGPLTVEQARVMAKEKAFKVSQDVDPSFEKKMSRKGETMEELCQDFLEKHAKQFKKSWDEDERRIQQRILPALGRKQVKKITFSDIQRIHQSIGKNHPTEANRVLALLKTVFSKAFTWHILPPNHIDPTKGHQMFKEVKRETWCTPEHLGNLIAAIKAYPNPIIREYLLFLLFTGLRRSEAAALEWKNVDFRRQLITLSDTKSGRPHSLPLNEFALDVLKKIPRQEGNPYVFWANSASGHVEEPKTAWAIIRTMIGLPDLRIHDLRRTHGSILATNNISTNIIGKVLNHSNPSTTAIYARLNDDPIRQAENTFAEVIKRTIEQQREENDEPEDQVEGCIEYII